MTTVRSRMIHRTTIERNTGSIDDDLGAEEIPDWDTPHLEDQPCFFYAIAGQEILEDRAVQLAKLRMLLPLDTDVHEGDRINGVVDRLGNDIFTGIMMIRSVLPHHSHLELDLERAN